MDEYKDEIEDYNDDSILEDEQEGEGENELYEHFRFTADRGQTQLRVDKFLVDRITGTSRNRIQQAADAGYILANGEPVKDNYRVKPYDIISVVLNRPRQELVIIPEPIPIDIVYEDDDLMVVNKPPGLVVHPGHGNYSGTLVNAIAWHLQLKGVLCNNRGNANDPRLGLVHRIDKETSGLLVIAKNPDAKTHLAAQFFHKTSKRQYVALVWGNVKADDGRIEGNIGRNPNDRMQMMVVPNNEWGKTAVTRYHVKERFGYTTLIECRLETGRTHQIRVHMKSIGHILFNDIRYGGAEILRGTNSTKYRQFIENCFDVCPRQALHAQTLGFIHPRTKEEMFFESPIPDDMAQLIEKWRRYE
ncbi:MAG: RluA family pseudouridine synthase [Candidatus Symbiothrix sp.]|nr:RluA family pseudouridine synthase [Candidatus Symbiothrix sp.]